MFAGILAGPGSSSVQSKAARLASDSASYPYLEAKPLHDSAALALYGIVRDDDARHLLTVTTSSRETVWLYRMDRSIRDGDALARQLEAHDWTRFPRLSGLWLALVWNERERTLRVVSERLGAVWLYVARCDGGIAFSCDFGALVRLLEGNVRVDRETALLELAFGYAPDDRTIFEEISLSPPGCISEYRGQDRRIVRASPLEFGDRYRDASRAEKFRALDGIFEQVRHESFSEPGLLISLSAGYDSRYGLALLGEGGRRCPLVTFGDAESLEVEGARAVAERAGGETTLFTFTEAQWDSWSRCIRSLGNPGMVQWAGWGEQWLGFLRERGGAAVIGYLGDALSGKHLFRSSTHSDDWLEHWLHWSAGPWASAPYLREDARQQLWPQARERFEQLSGGKRYGFPHQAALHFDLLGRQRRWVASQPNLMSRYLTPVTFFCHDELYDFWTNVPEEDLIAQALYLDYARERFPALFPKNEGKVDLLTRVVNKARALSRRLRGRLRERPQAVDRGEIVLQNREAILALVDASADRFGEWIDIPSLRGRIASLHGSERISPLESLLLIQVTNLFLITADRAP